MATSKYHLTAKERKVNAESSRKSPHLKGHVFLKNLKNSI